MSFVLVLLVLLLLAGLPLAVWLDLSNLADTNLRRQASDLNSVISSVRGYYAANVVGRVLASPGTTKVVHNYQEVPGAIPIPATLSLELGRVISEQQQNITYRFFRTVRSKIVRFTRSIHSRPTRSAHCVKIQISSLPRSRPRSSAIRFA